MDVEECVLIFLFYNEEKIIGEIVFILGLMESNVKVKLYWIRKKLYIFIIEVEWMRNKKIKD